MNCTRCQSKDAVPEHDGLCSDCIWEELDQVRKRLADVYVKDSARTREHNILVKENRELQAELERERRKAKELTK